MAIQSGDPIPKSTLTVVTPDGPQLRTTDEIFKGRKVVHFGVAGAFTPVCGKHHLPGFLDNLDQFNPLGVDEIAVTGVNDVFVMEAWAKSAGADGKISFLAAMAISRALSGFRSISPRAGSASARSAMP